MIQKHAVKETIWLLTLAIISWLLSYGLFTRLTTLSASGNLHDTYIISEPDSSLYSYFAEFFFLLLFITYGVKEAFRRYQNLLANGIFIIGAAFTLVLKAYFIAIPIWLTANKSQPTASGWTVKPPNVGETTLSEQPQFNLLENIETVFYAASGILLLSIIAMIIRGVYLIKKQKAVTTKP